MKTKKILLLLTFSLLCVSVKAQTLTFDETVKYINDQISCCARGDHKKVVVQAESDGKLTVINSNYGETVELTDYFKIPKKVDINEKYYGKGGNIYTTLNPDHPIYSIYRVRVIDTKGQLLLIDLNSEELAIRVAKAFAHLQSLCTPKAKDPFDN